ncbi:4Fe-4S dicluster domain-containing protein [bacterium]|nr:4Fe-4S dicluster domain-containing protein [bacterium]
MIVIDHNECLVCGACVGVCPVNAMSLDCAILRIQVDVCTLCEGCISICPIGALSIKELPE